MGGETRNRLAYYTGQRGGMGGLAAWGDAMLLLGCGVERSF